MVCLNLKCSCTLKLLDPELLNPSLNPKPSKAARATHSTQRRALESGRRLEAAGLGSLC